MYNEDWFLKKLEKTMRKSKVLKDIFGAISAAVIDLDETTDEVAKQIRPSTATILLDEWEKDFGMAPRTSYDTQFRQETLLAKEKSESVITLDVIKSITESFSGAEVEVASDTDDSLITINFAGTVGIPKNMEDLEFAIDDVIPAHMEAMYKFRYNTWADVKKLTWGQLKAYTWQQVKEGDLIAGNS